MQPCFFALSQVIPVNQAIALVKNSIQKAYGKRGEDVVARNLAAIDASLSALAQVAVADRTKDELAVDRAHETVIDTLIAGRGDLLPVSAMSVDGTYATGTAALEKRALAEEIPIWDPALCIDCGKCTIVCPHAAIRMKVFPPDSVVAAPEGFKTKGYGGHDLPAGSLLTIQVAPDDCTGCGICVAVCPVRDKAESRAQGHRPRAGDRAPRHRAPALRVLPRAARGRTARRCASTR